jgi:hypothetical protein
MYELVSQMSEIEYLPHPRGTSYRKKQHLWRRKQSNLVLKAYLSLKGD